MDAVNISFYSLCFGFILLVVPIAFSLYFKLALVKSIALATLRMAAQLVWIGFFLEFLFARNNAVLNTLWLFVMIMAAVYSVIRSVGLSMRRIIVPTFVSFTIATFTVVLYMNAYVLRLDSLFDARFLIVLGGMLLGNALRGNIVGIGSFYQSLRKDNKQYRYLLALGATQFEALLPTLRHTIQIALKPSLAAMGTMGIVALPGMMTGVILGGSDPTLAIKYQIMIMIGILVSTTISIVLAILTTMRVSFTPYGMLDESIFKEKKEKA